jgi:hypothetical protein
MLTKKNALLPSSTVLDLYASQSAPTVSRRRWLMLSLVSGASLLMEGCGGGGGAKQGGSSNFSGKLAPALVAAGATEVLTSRGVFAVGKDGSFNAQANATGTQPLFILNDEGNAMAMDVVSGGTMVASPTGQHTIEQGTAFTLIMMYTGMEGITRDQCARAWQVVALRPEFADLTSLIVSTKLDRIMDVPAVRGLLKQLGTVISASRSRSRSITIGEESGRFSVGLPEGASNADHATHDLVLTNTGYRVLHVLRRSYQGQQKLADNTIDNTRILGKQPDDLDVLFAKVFPPNLMRGPEPTDLSSILLGLEKPFQIVDTINFSADKKEDKVEYWYAGLGFADSLSQPPPDLDLQLESAAVTTVVYYINLPIFRALFPYPIVETIKLAQWLFGKFKAAMGFLYLHQSRTFDDVWETLKTAFKEIFLDETLTPFILSQANFSGAAKWAEHLLKWMSVIWLPAQALSLLETLVNVPEVGVIPVSEVIKSDNFINIVTIIDYYVSTNRHLFQCYAPPLTNKKDLVVLMNKSPLVFDALVSDASGGLINIPLPPYGSGQDTGTIEVYNQEKLFIRREIITLSGNISVKRKFRIPSASPSSSMPLLIEFEGQVYLRGSYDSKNLKFDGIQFIPFTGYAANFLPEKLTGSFFANGTQIDGNKSYQVSGREDDVTLWNGDVKFYVHLPDSINSPGVIGFMIDQIYTTTSIINGETSKHQVNYRYEIAISKQGVSHIGNVIPDFEEIISKDNEILELRGYGFRRI